MSEVAERFRSVAATFSERLSQVPADRWDSPSPCEGWVTRDVVRHLCDWVPGFIRSGSEVTIPDPPSVDADPVAAWAHLAVGIQRLLDDASTAASPFSHPMAGDHALADAIDRFVLGDVVIHTWDVARSAGLDETLDPAEVSRMLAGMEPMADVLEASGHYGRRVPVADDASDQDKLLALTGRTP